MLISCCTGFVYRMQGSDPKALNSIKAAYRMLAIRHIGAQLYLVCMLELMHNLHDLICGLCIAPQTAEYRPEMMAWFGGAVSRDQAERHADTGAAGGWSPAR